MRQRLGAGLFAPIARIQHAPIGAQCRNLAKIEIGEDPLCARFLADRQNTVFGQGKPLPRVAIGWGIYPRRPTIVIHRR